MAATGFVLSAASCSAPKGRLPDPQPTEPDLQLGALDLALLTPEGVALTEVSYAVRDAEAKLVDGDELSVGPRQTFSFFLELPVDAGYELTLTAAGEYEGQAVPCEGRARFNISEDQTTEVALDLVCTISGRAVRPATGGASVTANVSVEEGVECAVSSLTVGPLVVYRGESISVRGAAVPASADFEWSTSGSLAGDFVFDAGEASEGSFECTSGEGEIVLTITDGECSDEARVPVTCAPPSVCGDSRVDVGEDCDDGNTVDEDGCSDDCVAERCGDGIVQRGESCDDGNEKGGDGCSATCAEEFCGNGVLEGLEECDDANLTTGDGCSAGCGIEACGDGVVQAALDEQCDDGNHQDGDGCSEKCLFEDGDDDGVVDLVDRCDDTADTLVGTDGCSLEQRCPCDDPWESQQQYISCVANVLDGMFAAELIDADQRAALQLAAAERDCAE